MPLTATPFPSVFSRTWNSLEPFPTSTASTTSQPSCWLCVHLLLPTLLRRKGKQTAWIGSLFAAAAATETLVSHPQPSSSNTPASTAAGPPLSRPHLPPVRTLAPAIILRVSRHLQEGPVQHPRLKVPLPPGQSPPLHLPTHIAVPRSVPSALQRLLLCRYKPWMAPALSPLSLSPSTSPVLCPSLCSQQKKVPSRPPSQDSLCLWIPFPPPGSASRYQFSLIRAPSVFALFSTRSFRISI